VHKIFQNIEMTRAFFNPFTQDYQNSLGQNYQMLQTDKELQDKEEINMVHSTHEGVHKKILETDPRNISIK
jgi:hypothetical protein